MIELPPEARKTALIPEVRQESQTSAEIFVGPRAITVTVSLPALPERDLDLVLTRTSIRLRSRGDAQAPSFVIPLPVEVDPGRYVLRHKHGLLDFTIERASR